MKRTSRVLAILLALAMLLSVTAFAADKTTVWPVYGSNANHNSVVDGAPKVVKEGVSKEEAEDIKKKLEEAGAKATIK